MGRSF